MIEQLFSLLANFFYLLLCVICLKDSYSLDSLNLSDVELFLVTFYNFVM